MTATQFNTARLTSIAPRADNIIDNLQFMRDEESGTTYVLGHHDVIEWIAYKMFRSPSVSEPFELPGNTWALELLDDDDYTADICEQTFDLVFTKAGAWGRAYRPDDGYAYDAREDGSPIRPGDPGVIALYGDPHVEGMEPDLYAVAMD